MTTMLRPRRRALTLGAAAAALALAAAGCGGDDDGPTNPGGRTDRFDEATALAQAQTAAPQAVSLVESMTAIAAGFTKDGEKDYAWNPETQRWEYTYQFTGEGYVYDWSYTVQYLDGTGTPQQNAAGAASVAHDMHGVGSFHYEDGGAVLDYDYVWDYSTTIAGLGTDTLVMTGNGGQDIDYTYTSPQGNQSARYAATWEILAPGITIVGEGCPVGTIRYDFAPYSVTVVFNGTGTATATMRDAGGNVIPEGSGTHPLSCGAAR